MSIDERELERIAGRLGAEAAEALDIERVAQRVSARLQEAEQADQQRARRPGPLVRWAAVAAGIALVVAGSVVTFRAGPAPTSTAQVAAGLYDLSSDELTEVLDSLSWHAPVSAQFAIGLDDLDASELRELLAMMEG